MTRADALRPLVTPSPEGCVLALIVSPRAGKTAFNGLAADGLRLRVAAPPTGGAANTAVVRFLAEVFDVSASRAQLIAGVRGRRKRAAIAGLSADGAITRLEALLAD